MLNIFRVGEIVEYIKYLFFMYENWVFILVLMLLFIMVLCICKFGEWEDGDRGLIEFNG